MNRRILLNGITAACMASAIGAYAPVSANGVSANGQSWTANGGSACEKFLTPDVVSEILSTSAAPMARLDATSCHTGSIYIHLKVADIDVFRPELKMIAGTHQIPGVGDGAYWNEAGALSAVKGHDRGCDISVAGAPYVTKIGDEALGQKLGEICKKLFALP